ncbi:MAG: glycosyltransferase [Propionibacteriaceae bacterium]|nr:glycosyltransferase [Propionibacteriaceae bacterium]
MIKLSVIIPVFNVASYVGQCIQSVLQQTCVNMEVICIDDGSSDNSAVIVQQISDQDNRVQLHRQKNQGQAAARNRGMELARGEFIYFLDADDYIDSSFAEECINEMTANDYDLLFFDGNTFTVDDLSGQEEHNCPQLYQRITSYPGVWKGSDLFAEMMKRREFRVQPCMYITRRDFIIDNKLTFPEGIIREDELYTVQAILSAKRCGHLDRILFNRRLHSNSTMTSRPADQHVEGLIAVSQGYRSTAKTMRISVRAGWWLLLKNYGAVRTIMRLVVQHPVSAKTRRSALGGLMQVLLHTIEFLFCPISNTVKKQRRTNLHHSREEKV